MSIKKLEEKHEDLQAEMSRIKERAEEWREKRAEAEAALKEAAVEGRETRELAVTAHEARVSIKALGERYGELERELEAVRERLLEAQHEEGYEALQQRRADVVSMLVESNHRIIEFILSEFEAALGEASAFNHHASRFNSRYAGPTGLPRVEHINNLSSHDLESFTRTLVRTYLLEGRDALDEPIMPLPSHNPAVRTDDIYLPSNRRASNE